MSKLTVLAEPMFVGRQKELEELQSFMDSAIEGKGRTVFVSGEAGSGKTRLTREFLKSIVKHGVAVMAGWCLSDSQVPYFPFMEAFNNYYANANDEDTQSSLLQPLSNFELGTPSRVGVESGKMEITSWLTGQKPARKAGELSPQAWKDQVFAAVSETLHAITGHGPVVLFVEDIHWADTASLSLLHYIARAIKEKERVLLLATYRSEELTTDPEGRPHPLAESLRMMRREDLFAEIKLPSLDHASVSKMAQSMLGSCVQPDFTEKLTIQSGGSPLFIVESLRMLNERGGLIKEGACVRLDIDKVSIPSKFKDIILRRLGSLRLEQRRVLDAASVIGEEFNVEFLSGVLGLVSLSVLETLNVISHSTSLVVDVGDCYRFDHARSRETLYEELSPSLRRGYHNRIGEKLEETKSPPLSDLAYHFAQAGNKEKAVKYALAAGEDDLAKYSNAQAVKHFQYVLQNTSNEDAEQRRAALEGLGDAYAASSMYGEAIKTFDQLAATETGIRKFHAFRKASDVAFVKGDVPDLLVEYARKAEALDARDRLEMARIIDNRGKAWGWAGRGTPKMDLADYDAALSVFEEENSLLDVAEALCRSGFVCAAFFEDLQERGLGELLRSLAIFRESGEVRKQAEISLQTASGYHACGLYDESVQAFLSPLKIGEKLGIFSEMAHACAFLTRYFYSQSNLERSLFYAQKGFEYSSKTDSKQRQAQACANLVGLYCQLGDLNRADEYFGKIGALMPPDFWSNNVAFATVYAGVYFAAKGRWEESEQSFKKALEFFKVTTYGVERFVRRNYAWALEKHGLVKEAKIQRDIIELNFKLQKEKTEATFGHANLQLSLMLPRNLTVGELAEMRLDLVNVGRKSAALLKVEGVAVPDLKFSSLPSFCSQRSESIILINKSVGPFEVETIKLKFSAAKSGSYSLAPEVFYADDLGNMKTFKVTPIAIIVEPAKFAYEVLPGRVATGTAELDKLLFGGIPEGYSVALVAPYFEERQMIIENYLEAGLKSDQTTFYLTAEPGSTKAFAEEYPSGMFLFVCSPRADLMVKDLPNVYRIRGLDSLTEIDIALTKALRQLSVSSPDSRRACIEIASEILLQHHAVTTRKWLTGLIQDLKLKGFTIMAVIDPLIAPEEVPAVTSLFDGEVRIIERTGVKGSEKILKVSRLYNKNYQKNELTLSELNPSI